MGTFEKTILPPVGRSAQMISTNKLFVREVLEVDMKIGVSGASGHLGRAVVSELLQRPGGHEVVAITRTPETISAPAQGRFGDYDGIGADAPVPSFR